MRLLTLLLAEGVELGDGTPDSVTRIIDGLAVLSFPHDFNGWLYAQVLLEPSEEGQPFTASIDLVEPSGGVTEIGSGPVQGLIRADPDLPVVFNYVAEITLGLPERGLYWLRLSTSTGFSAERPFIVGRM